MSYSAIIILFLVMVVLTGTCLGLMLLIKTETPYLEVKYRQRFALMLLIACLIGALGIGLLATLV